MIPKIAVDPLATWFLTYSLHSAILAALGLMAARAWLAPGSRQSAVLKVALFGALFSATMPWKAVSPLEVMGGEAASMERTAMAPMPAGPTPTLSSEAAPPGSVAASAGPVSTAPFLAGPFPWGRTLMTLVVAISALLIVRLVLQRRRFITTLRRKPLDDEVLSSDLAAWAKEAGTAPVCLSGSAHLAAPVVLSSTEICVPLECWEHLSPKGRKALLAHEFAHIERRDPAWFTAAAALERVFFFLPWHRALRQRLNASAEVVCDAIAAKRIGSRTEVARCLADVATWAQGAGRQSTVPSSIPAMAAGPGELVSRVQQLLVAGERPTSRRFAMASAAGLLAFACCTPALTNRPSASSEADNSAIAIEVSAGGVARASRSGASPDLEGIEVDLNQRSGRDALQEWLAVAARDLPSSRDIGGPSRSIEIHDEPFVIHAGKSVLMKQAQRLMSMAGALKVGMPNVVLRVDGVDYPTPLPVDLGATDDYLVQRMDIRLDPAESGAGVNYRVGSKVEVSGAGVPREVEEDEEEPVEVQEPTLARSVGELRTLLSDRVKNDETLQATIDPRKGVDIGSVTEVMNVLSDLGIDSITFKGSYER